MLSPLGREHVYPDPRESRVVVPRKSKRESVRLRGRGISRRIEPGDKRAAVNLNLKLLSLILGGIRAARRVVLAGLRGALTFADRGLQSRERLHRFNIVNHFVCAENCITLRVPADRKEDEIIRAACMDTIYTTISSAVPDKSK